MQLLVLCFLLWNFIYKQSFELSTFGSKLKDLVSKAAQPDNAYMHADTAAGPACFKASLQAILRCMIGLIGIGATCIGIVKAEC